MAKLSKVAHITEDCRKLSGGMQVVVRDINNYLLQNNIASKILTTKAELDDNNIIVCPPSLYGDVWRYANSFKRNLLSMDASIYHIHCIWMHPQYLSAKIAFKNNIPYIISPHGLLDRYKWKKSFVKKKLYFNLIYKYFASASALHAITEQERSCLFKIFRHKNIELITNFISYKTFDAYKIKRQNKEKFILFVGRLEKLKGVDILIKAFSNLDNSNISLKIVAPFNKYQKKLVRLVKKLGIEDRVDFLGFVDGIDKLQLYKDAWVFAMPSHSEVIGMVNLEAAVLSTPVITTYQTGLNKNWNSYGGMLINPRIALLTQALTNAINWSDAERDDRAKALRKFVIEHYSWEQNAYKWIDLYENI